ncbi:MAG TPA: hypothetical protein VF150_04590, partial [Thermoanaerobaculia bacterium]
MSLPRPDSSTASPLEWGARLAAPVAAVLAMASLAAFQADPRTAAETAYLALATGVALLAAAAVSWEGRRPAVEAVAGPVLVTAAVWTLPEGPPRGAVALALATATLTVAALRWLAARPAASEARPGAVGGEGTDRLPAVPCLALAVGLQALLRGGELLGLGWGAGWGPLLRSLLLFAVFPAVGAAAVLALARLHGRRRALLAAAAVLLVGPGLRPATLAVLVALAVAPVLLAPRGNLARLAALGLLAAPFVWDLRAGGAALVAGLAGAWAGRGEATGYAEARPRFRAWIPAAL